MVVKIEHCLLSKGGPEKVRVILSHPQGLAQCRHFLKKHFPDAELRSTGSTSHAARLAGEFEEMAAIASPEAAECYGLKVLLSNIQDRKENYTRFIVLKAGKKALTEQVSFAGEIKGEAHPGSESGYKFQSELEAGSGKCSSFSLQNIPYSISGKRQTWSIIRNSRGFCEKKNQSDKDRVQAFEKGTWGLLLLYRF